MNIKRPLWIMIAGPYGSGTKTLDEKAANLEELNRVALSVFEKGHIPIIGVNNALPLISIAGESSFNSIIMPLSLALAERCDCCLRVGGQSTGADQEVERFMKQNKKVYYAVSELPEV